MLDTLHKRCVCHGCGNDRRVAQRRNLVAEEGADAYCTGCGFKRNTEAFADTHTGNTHSGERAPGRAGKRTHQCAENTCHGQEKGRGDDLHTVVDHYRNGSGSHPCADENTDC